MFDSCVSFFLFLSLRNFCSYHQLKCGEHPIRRVPTRVRARKKKSLERGCVVIACEKGEGAGKVSNERNNLPPTEGKNVLVSILDEHLKPSEVDSIHLNEKPRQSVAVFSLSSSSSSSSLNEPAVLPSLMSTRLLPAGCYHEPDAGNSPATNDSNGTSASLIKCLSSYREQMPFGSSCSSSSSTSSTSSTSTNPSTKKDFLSSIKSAGHYLPTVDTLTIEQNLFNMVRFDVVKSNFCDYYQLGDFVRSGGFSDIHEGVRLSDNKPVVVKFIPKEKTKNWLMINQKKYPAEVLLHKAVHEIQGRRPCPSTSPARAFPLQASFMFMIISRMRNIGSW